MKTPSLSVIVPNYNHAKFLARCLNALLAQTVQPMEIIIIDDASSDNSMEVIEGFAKEHCHLKVYRNDRNRGVIFTANRGVDLARGEYICFAPSDDETFPRFFENSLSLLSKYPQAAFACGISEFREAYSGIKWQLGNRMAERPCFLSPQQLIELGRRGRLHITPNTSVIRRDALIRAGKYIPGLRWHTDWFAFHVAAFRQGICFVPELLAIFYVHKKSYYKQGSSRRIRHMVVLRRILRSLLSEGYKDVGDMIRYSGELYLFGWPMLRFVVTQPEFRRFLNATFLKKNLWHITKLTLKRVTPAFLGNLYFRFAGYRARTSSVAP